MPLFKRRRDDDFSASFEGYVDSPTLSKSRINFWFLGLIVVLGLVLVASYILPKRRFGNAAKDLEKGNASVLKQEAEERENPNDGIPRFTSDEAPWFSSDDNGTIYLHPEKFEGEKLVIPSEFDGNKIYTVSAEGLSDENDTVTSLQIAEGIQVIEDGAFENFEALKEVTIPKTVIHINGTAFHNTPWYEGLQDEFAVVGNGVLIKYTGTDKVVLVPETVAYIDGGVFKDLSTATSIELPQSAVYIGDRAFQNCKATNVSGGDNISYIANNAFFGCDWIDEIEDDFATLGKGCMVKYTITDNTIRIPDTVRQISGLDLENSGEDVTMIIGANVLRVADIRALGFVKAFKVDKDSNVFSVVSGVLYNTNETTLYRFPVYKSKKSYYATEKLRTIGEFAFSDTSLEYVEFYDGLTTIGEKAFYNADNLAELELPGTVVKLGAHAFLDCDELEEVALPEKLSTLKYGVFKGCDSLEHVIIPESVNKILPLCFSQCESLEKLFIPKSVAQVSNYFDYKAKIELEIDPKNPYLLLEDGKLSPRAKKQ